MRTIQKIHDFFYIRALNVKLTRRNRDNISVALIFLFDLGANGRFAMNANDFQQRSGDLSTPFLLRRIMCNNYTFIILVFAPIFERADCVRRVRPFEFLGLSEKDCWRKHECDLFAIILKCCVARLLSRHVTTPDKPWRLDILLLLDSKREGVDLSLT